MVITRALKIPIGPDGLFDLAEDSQCVECGLEEIRLLVSHLLCAI